MIEMLVEKEVTMWSVLLKPGLSQTLDKATQGLLESGELPRMEFALPLGLMPSSPALPS